MDGTGWLSRLAGKNGEELAVVCRAACRVSAGAVQVCSVCSVQCDRCRQIWKGRGGVVLAVLVVLVVLELLALLVLLGQLLVLALVLMLLLLPRLLGAWFEWRTLFFFPFPVQQQPRLVNGTTTLA